MTGAAAAQTDGRQLGALGSVCVEIITEPAGSIPAPLCRRSLARSLAPRLSLSVWPSEFHEPHTFSPRPPPLRA